MQREGEVHEVWSVKCEVWSVKSAVWSLKKGSPIAQVDNNTATASHKARTGLAGARRMQVL